MGHTMFLINISFDGNGNGNDMAMAIYVFAIVIHNIPHKSINTVITLH